MTTAIHNEIRQALETKLQAVNATFVPPYEVAWEGQVMDPAAKADKGRSWLSSKILRGPSRATGLGVTGTLQHDGIYQIAVFVPQGTGAGDLLALASSIAEPFTRATLTAGGFTIQCGVPSLSPVLPEPSWLQVAISVPFYAHS